MLPCLSYAIGLTRSNDPCIINGLTPEQIAELKRVDNRFELYLDEIEGGISWQAVKAIDSRSYYDKVVQARKNAAQVMELDLIRELSLRYKTGKKQFTGALGQKAYTQSLSIPQAWQGLKITPNDYTDAVFIIKSIEAAINMGGFVDYCLIKVPVGGSAGEIVNIWSANEVIGNSWSKVSAFQPVPAMFVEENQVYEYYIVFDRTQIAPAAQPKNNELTCNCSGAAAQKPSEYAQVQGISFELQSDSLATGSQVTLLNLQSDNFAHGLLIQVEFNCDTSGLFCKEYQAKDEIKATMSAMLRHKTQYHLQKALYNSNETNRYTTMGKDLLVDNMKIFQSQYEKMIPFLIDTIDISEAGSCFTCKERANQPQRRTVFL